MYAVFINSCAWGCTCARVCTYNIQQRKRQCTSGAPLHVGGKENDVKYIALVVVCVVSLRTTHAQDASGAPETDEYTFANYTTQSYAPDALLTMQRAVFERVSALHAKRTRSELEHRALLHDAQLLANLYSVMEAEDIRRKTAVLLIAVRDEYIEYARMHPKDYGVQVELAFLVSTGFDVYAKDSYQSARLVREIAARVYNNAPNAKAALLLGLSYVSAHASKRRLMIASLAERYLRKAVELDGQKSYITYLAYIYFANLYFKTRSGTKARHYIQRAQALYPGGTLAYVVDEFFAEGTSFF